MAGLVFGLERRVAGHLANVRTGNKRLVARAGQNDAAHCCVIFRILEGRFQIGDGLFVEGVEHFGAVEGHICDGALLLVKNGFKMTWLQLTIDSRCPSPLRWKFRECDTRQVPVRRE